MVREASRCEYKSANHWLLFEVLYLDDTERPKAPDHILINILDPVPLKYVHTAASLNNSHQLIVNKSPDINLMYWILDIQESPTCITRCLMF